MEHHLEEGDDPYLLLKVGQFLHNSREARNDLVVFLNGLRKGCDLAASKGLQGVVKPLEISVEKRLQQFLVKLNN